MTDEEIFALEEIFAIDCSECGEHSTVGNPTKVGPPKFCPLCGKPLRPGDIDEVE